MNRILQFISVFVLLSVNAIAQNDCIPLGEDFCEDAAILSLCQLDGWMSNTNPPGVVYTPDVIGDGWCGGNFTIENNQWLGFIADETQLTINVDISDCEANAGVQLACYAQGEGTSCIGTQLSCLGFQSGENVNFNFNIFGLIPGDTYILMIDGFAGDGCPFTFNIEVGTNNPVIAQANPLSVCPGIPNAAALNGLGSAFGPGVVYIWETQDGNIVSGANTLFPIIDQPGEYTLTVIDNTSCCINSTSVLVEENTEYPDAVANVDGIISCTNDEVTLSATGSSGAANDNNFFYQWYGPDGNDIALGYELDGISEPGTYSLQVLNAETGCLSETTVEVPFDTISPTVAPSADGIIGCINTSLTIDGNGSSGVDYLWSGPGGFTDVVASPTISVGGEYMVTVVGDNGCTNSASIDIPVDTLPPNISVQGASINCINTLATISAASTDDNITFEWNAGTGAEIEVATAAEYTVVATGENGCTATATALVEEDTTPPSATAGVDGQLNCTITELVLDGSSMETNVSFEWISPSGTLLNEEDPTVSEAGVYNLTVTNENNGCTGTASIPVSEDMTPPDIITAVDDVLDCTIEVVNLSGTTLVDNPIFEWIGPNGFAADIANPTTENPGDYTLTVTGENGCTSTSTINVEQDNTDPIADAGPDGIITCTATEAAIDGSASSTGSDFSYQWINAGGVELSTELNTEVSSTGTFTLVVTNTSNGCTASDEVAIDADEDLPISDAGLPQLIDCINNEVTLDGSTSSASPTITYQWLDATGNSLGTMSTLETDMAGIYTLLVMDSSNGCDAQSQVEVSNNTVDPIALIAQPETITCITPNVSIDGSTSTGMGTLQYLWTDEDGNMLSTLASFESDEAGVYNLLITDNENACTATEQITVLEDTVLPQANAGDPATITCIETQVALNGSTSQGENLIYEWTDGTGTIVSTEASTMTDNQGDYNLLVTNTVNGCTDSDQVTIGIDADFPLVNVGSPTSLTCAITEVELNGTNSSGGTNLLFEWQDSNGTTVGNDAIATINNPDTYTLIVTNLDNDCVAEETIIIPQDIVPPASDAGNNQIITCDVTEVFLDGSNSTTGGNLGYEWTNDGGVVIGNILTVPVSSPGTYSLLVTNMDNGCTDLSTVVVEPDENIPTAVSNLDGILTCTNTEINLDNIGSSTGTSFTYTWTDNNGNMLGQEGSIIVSSPGVYNMLVTNEDNGCTNETSIQVEENTVLPISEAGEPAILTCATTSVALDGSASTANSGNFSYEWFNENNISISVAESNIDVEESGIYTLVITDIENGCTDTDMVEVTPDENLPTAIAGEPQTLTCVFTETILDGNASSAATVGSLDFEWQSPNGTLLSETASTPITEPGVYTLLVTDDSNGCSAVSTVEILQDIANPIPAIASPDLLTCTVESVVLDASASTGIDVVYEWQNSNGVVVGNTVTTSVDEAGMYSLILTDNSNGCSAMTQTEVIPDANLPTALVQVDDILTCIVEEVTLSNTGSSVGDNFSYQWQSPTGILLSTDESLTADAPGIYTLLVSDSENGCISETSIEVELNNAPPQAIIEDNNPLMTCDVESVLLNGAASTPSGMISYEWFNSGGVLVSNMANPEVENVDVYSLIVTNVINGCTHVSSIEVAQDLNVPIVNIPTPDIINCYNPSVDVLSTGSSAGNFTYEWTSADGTLLSNESSISVGSSGVYELTIINNLNGCDNTNSIQVNIDQIPPEAVTSVEDILDCVTPSVLLNSEGSSIGNQFVYEWSGVGLLSNASTPNPEVNMAGIYNLQITNTDNGCTTTSMVDVDENTAQPNAGLISAADPSCFGLIDGTIGVDAIVGGTSPYLYSFNGGPLSPELDFNNLPSGSYTLEVEDATGCTWDTLLNLVDPIQIDVELGPDLTVQLGESVEIDALVNVDTDVIDWEGTDSLSCMNCLTQNLTPTQSGPYTITVFDENGCTDTDEIFLRVEIVRPVYIPNAFSPGDENGINDTFIVYSGDLAVKEVLNMTVADRWGEIVFTNSNFQPNEPTEGWDGVFRGQEMDPQVFAWFAEVEFIDGKVILYKGDVTLIK